MGLSVAQVPTPFTVAGMLGDGSDGAAVLDGVAAVAWATLTGGNTYTMTRGCGCTAITINNGITLVPLGWSIFCQGAFVNHGAIDNGRGQIGSSMDGGAGAASGTAGSGGSFPATVNTVRSAISAGNTWLPDFGIGTGGAGGAGNTGAGSTGGNIPGASFQQTAALGGAGGAGSNGAGGSAGVGGAMRGGPFIPLRGPFAYGNATGPQGTGGGGGGGDAVNKGGGGGGGGANAPALVIFSRSFDNTSGTIQALGGNGGNGGTPTLGNAGGGGGGAGGSGGNIFLAALTVVAWGTRTLTGGIKGTHGNGVGTGANGVDGTNGPNGFTLFWNLSTGLVSLP